MKTYSDSPTCSRSDLALVLCWVSCDVTCARSLCGTETEEQHVDGHGPGMGEGHLPPAHHRVR